MSSDADRPGEVGGAPAGGAADGDVERLRADLDALRVRHESLLRELEDRQGALTADLHAAERFQRSILPPPPSLPGMEIDVLYRPLDLVGGDIYDVTAIEQDRVRIFLADATGHGVRASLTTMFIKSEYEIIKRTVKGPTGVLRVLNERISRTYRHLDMRFTALCLNIDFKKGVLSYASAAHPAPCLVRGGAAVESGGPFMGLLPDVAFPEGRVEFRPGDAVYVFTDGLPEAASPDGKVFGERRVYEALVDALRMNRPARQVVTERVDEFVAGGAGRGDDMTLVGLRWTGIELPHDEVDSASP